MPARWSALTRSRNSSTAAVRTLPARVGGMRGEERHGLVAPVVDQAGRRGQAVEREDRQQLDGGDPELDEIRDLVDEPCVGPAPGGRQAGAGVGGEARQMRLVDDRLAPAMSERAVALPVVRAGVDHDALHGGRVIGPVARSDPAVAVRRGDRPAVWVEQQPGRVEAQPLVGIPGSVGGEPVELAGLDRRARGRASSRRSGWCSDRGGSDPGRAPCRRRPRRAAGRCRSRDGRRRRTSRRRRSSSRRAGRGCRATPPSGAPPAVPGAPSPSSPIRDLRRHPHRFTAQRSPASSRRRPRTSWPSRTTRHPTRGRRPARRSRSAPRPGRAGWRSRAWPWRPDRSG